MSYQTALKAFRAAEDRLRELRAQAEQAASRVEAFESQARDARAARDAALLAGEAAPEVASLHADLETARGDAHAFQAAALDAEVALYRAEGEAYTAVRGAWDEVLAPRETELRATLAGLGFVTWRAALGAGRNIGFVEYLKEQAREAEAELQGQAAAAGHENVFYLSAAGPKGLPDDPPESALLDWDARRAVARRIT